MLGSRNYPAGYQHLPVLSNDEWPLGFAPTFGLIEWDKLTFERASKRSAVLYAGVARANAL